MVTARYLAYGVVTALLVQGCEERSPSPDSADVDSWEVRERLTIGVEAGDPPFEFGRIANVVKLSDGRIVVADGGNLEVRLFTPDGGHQLTFGRRGAGPGEFSSLTRLARIAGDTLLVGSNSRLARYTPEGVYLSEERLDWSGFSRPPYFVEYAWPLTDRAFALTLLRTSVDQPAEMPLHRSTVMFLVTTRNDVIDSLGVFRALEQLSYRDGAEIHTALPLFPPDTRTAFSHGHLVIGDTDADSVLRYELIGRRQTWVKVPLARRTISPAALEYARATACEWAPSPETRSRCEKDLLQLPRQTHYPVFRDLAVDSLGAIWVATYTPDPRSDVSEWHIVDGAGRTLATAALPTNLRLARIGESYAIGVARDSLGVERVKEFHVLRRLERVR